MNSTAFNSVGWTYGDTSWAEQQIFNGYNGHGGVGCYSWGPTSDTYVFFINLQNEVNILWKELNTTLKGNATHPIDVWTTVGKYYVSEISSNGKHFQGKG